MARVRSAVPRPMGSTSTERHDWQDRAECKIRGLDPELFFPKWGDQIPREVISACSACQVRLECLRLAFRIERGKPERHGIWGGLTAKQRTWLAAGRKIVFPAVSYRNRTRRNPA